jgi:phenylalanyl-tRNA synthetase alpha chain
MSDLEQARDDGLGAVAATSTLDELRTVEAEVLGKRGALARAKAGLGALPPEQRRDAGRAVNEAIATVQAAADQRRAALASVARQAQLAAERLDLTEAHRKARRGHAHLVTRATERLEDTFVGLGFQIAEGPEVESDWYSFTALNMPPSHPARSEWDTLFVEHGTPGSTLLRPHTSPVQIRVMETTAPPIYAVMPGRVFRRDTADATHMPVFHQLEGLVVDRGITFADLAGTIEQFTKAFFGADFTSRLRPSYFPFTEPSAEFDIRRPDGTWLELGGCGMVHPNVFTACGLDPEVWTGFAFGFGIDRMAKERHGVADLREMFTNDIRFIEQFGGAES